jgi:hypothetical protein
MLSPQSLPNPLSLFQAHDPSSMDGERESQPPARDSVIARILGPFLNLSQRVSEGVRWFAAFTVRWVVMLGLPLIYERRLAKLGHCSGEQLALEQIPAHEAERSGGASTQALDESNPSGIQMGRRLAKRCVLEWRACAMLNTVTLGYAFQLP